MNASQRVNQLSGLAGVLALVASAAGLALPGLYRDVPYWTQQARGTDLATLALAVPLLGAGLWLSRRASVAGRLVTTAGILYLTYSYAIFAFAVAMNPLTLVYIAILGLAVYSLGLTLVPGRLDEAGLATRAGLPIRAGATTLAVVALLFGLLWLAQIAGTTLSGALPPDLVRANLPTNPVYALDLGLFLPLCLVAAVGLVRGQLRAASFAIPMLIWLSLTSAGIVAGFAFAVAAGDVVPLAVAVMVAAIGVVTGLLALVGIRRMAAAPDAARFTREAYHGARP